jgi:general stress protein YciG
LPLARGNGALSQPPASLIAAPTTSATRTEISKALEIAGRINIEVGSPSFRRFAISKNRAVECRSEARGPALVSGLVFVKLERKRFGGDHMTEERQKPKSKRGFASMDPEKQREIAKKGGKSVPDEKRAFSQSADLASRAGQKGGRNVDPKKRSFSQDRALAVSAGAKGGAAFAKSARPKEP